MLLNQNLRSLVGQPVQGTLGLQLLLQDHATEETLAAIQRAVGAPSVSGVSVPAYDTRA